MSGIRLAYHWITSFNEVCIGVCEVVIVMYAAPQNADCGALFMHLPTVVGEEHRWPSIDIYFI